MTSLGLLSEEVGVSERTLRRAVNEGTLKGNRLGPRRLDVPLSEKQFVRRSWPLLSVLRRTLRTESNVRFAMLFGSTATGRDRPHSDVDLLVALRDPSVDRVVDLSDKLSKAVERPVDLVRLEDAEADPALLADWIAEGRVVVDRERVWHRLQRRLSSLAKAGGEREVERTTAALAEIDRMLERR